MKIGGGFALMFALLAYVAYITHDSLENVLGDARRVEESELVLHHVDDINGFLAAAESEQRGFLITGESHYQQAYEQLLPQLKEELAALLAITKTSSYQAQLPELSTQVLRRLDDLTEGMRLQRQDGAAHKSAVASTADGEVTMDAVQKILNEIMRVEEGELRELRAHAAIDAVKVQRIIIGTSLLALALVLLCGIGLTRHIARPLRTLSTMAESISYGELSVRPTLDARTDEVGMLNQSFARMVDYLQEMARVAGNIADNNLAITVAPVSTQDVLGTAFTQMATNLRMMVREVQEAMGVLAAAVQEMAATTTQLAAGSAETAAAVSETTSTIEEVRQTTQVATHKAQFVAESAQEVTTVAQTGQRAVEESLEAMSRIRGQVDLIAQSIVRQSEQTQAIGEIIATVNDLAEQSNLLAVNAAIEAAKAGEQGRGFAVVAQEVRSLAEQSKQATQRIRAIIGEIQKSTSATVMATEQGSKAAERGLLLATESGEAIQILLTTIDRSAQAAQQIARSSDEQLIGVDQVATAMENIKVASLQNVDSARQVEGAARDLHDLGTKLKAVTQRFTV
jgi:methyl-accepting chemotaxis protein